jgi:mRNA interferase RelE/StbE
MSYSVKLHPDVVRFLEKCEKELSERIEHKFKLLKEDPFRFLEHFEGQDFYKLRVGDYRALIDVDKERKIIFVRFLDKRSRVYKRK